MRSLKYYAAALPLHFLAASAGRPEYDTTVVVTQTRTVTVCPVIDMFKCAQPEPTRPWKDWTTKATTTSSTVTTSTTTEKEGGYETTTTTKSTKAGETTSSTTTKSTRPGETTTSTSSTKSTSSGEVTSSTTTSSEKSTTTTSTSSTTSKGPYTCPTSGDYTCPSKWNREGNSPGKRSNWADGKSIEHDSHESYSSGQTVNYELTLTKGEVDADGAGSRPVMLVNGKTPGETIEANWGDWVVIKVTNQLGDNVTSIHWHGIRQEGTNDQDGVPGVTECGIAPGKTRTYKWRASSYGTGWYHSHALSQYAAGIRGAIVIHGPATADYDYDMGPVMIDEKLRESAFTLAYNVSHTQGPLPPASNVLFNGKNTSPDNLKGQATKYVVRSGKKHLFRIINSSAQSAYAVHFDYHNMTVISADFVPIVPYVTDTLWIGSGQRYNVIVEANQNSSAYYLRAISQTGCGSVSVNDGKALANAIFEYDDSLGATPLTWNASSIATPVCKDEPAASLVPYKSKEAGSLADFQAKAKLVGSGNPGLLLDPRNVSKPAIRWFMGPADELSKNVPNYNATAGINVTFEEPTLKLLRTIPDNAATVASSAYVLSGGETDWVYFVLQSSFHTSHPMHLHGHDFSLLGQGTGVFDASVHGPSLNFKTPPRRDSANLYGARGPTPTQGWTVIGFQADNPGAWLMHCHILWHADGGMGLQYIERQSEIKDYYSNQEFKDQCSAVEDYHLGGGVHKDFYESGVKRHLAEHAAHAKRHGHAI